MTWKEFISLHPQLHTENPELLHSDFRMKEDVQDNDDTSVKYFHTSPRTVMDPVLPIQQPRDITRVTIPALFWRPT